MTNLRLHPQPGTPPANLQAAVRSGALAANIGSTTVSECLGEASGAELTGSAFARYTQTERHRGLKNRILNFTGRSGHQHDAERQAGSTSLNQHHAGELVPPLTRCTQNLLGLLIQFPGHG